MRIGAPERALLSGLHHREPARERALDIGGTCAPRRGACASHPGPTSGHAPKRRHRETDAADRVCGLKLGATSQSIQPMLCCSAASRSGSFQPPKIWPEIQAWVSWLIAMEADVSVPNNIFRSQDLSLWIASRVNGDPAADKRIVARDVAEVSKAALRERAVLVSATSSVSCSQPRFYALQRGTDEIPKRFAFSDNRSDSSGLCRATA
jgi:hypothetical protein